jgi:muramoyltetrapeptide carboxypeptidase LdcA involved in peptidoglycan recycling
VLSPSGRSAARFPAPFELGLQRLRDELGLVPVEYPTTRAAQAAPEKRAEDLHAAFSDSDIRAVIASIGGEDELKVLAHLDADVLASNPKPFFGYSDNTNLHLFLWNLGIVSYHGCAVMVQLGRPGSMHPLTLESLRRALFTHETYALTPATEFGDEEGDWGDPKSLVAEPPMFPSDGWSWHGPQSKVTGPAWGGSLEIIDFHLRANRYLLSEEAYEGAVLFLETSEELPPASSSTACSWAWASTGCSRASLRCSGVGRRPGRATNRLAGGEGSVHRGSTRGCPDRTGGVQPARPGCLRRRARSTPIPSTSYRAAGR